MKRSSLRSTGALHKSVLKEDLCCFEGPVRGLAMLSISTRQPGRAKPATKSTVMRSLWRLGSQEDLDVLRIRVTSVPPTSLTTGIYGILAARVDGEGGVSDRDHPALDP